MTLLLLESFQPPSPELKVSSPLRANVPKGEEGPTSTSATPRKSGSRSTPRPAADEQQHARDAHKGSETRSAQLPILTYRVNKNAPAMGLAVRAEASHASSIQQYLQEGTIVKIHLPGAAKKKKDAGGELKLPQWVCLTHPVFHGWISTTSTDGSKTKYIEPAQLYKQSFVMTKNLGELSRYAKNLMFHERKQNGIGSLVKQQSLLKRLEAEMGSSTSKPMLSRPSSAKGVRFDETNGKADADAAAAATAAAAAASASGGVLDGAVMTGNGVASAAGSSINGGASLSVEVAGSAAGQSAAAVGAGALGSAAAIGAAAATRSREGSSRRLSRANSYEGPRRPSKAEHQSSSRRLSRTDSGLERSRRSSRSGGEAEGGGSPGRRRRSSTNRSPSPPKAADQGGGEFALIVTGDSRVLLSSDEVAAVQRTVMNDGTYDMDELLGLQEMRSASKSNGVEATLRAAARRNGSEERFPAQRPQNCLSIGGEGSLIVPNLDLCTTGKPKKDDSSFPL